MTWAIPWSPGSLPLWPRVPVTALKPLQAPVLLTQFQSRPLLHVESWLHACIPSGSEDPYWAASGPLGPWNPHSPVISTLPLPTPPQSRAHPQGCPLPGVLQGPPLSAPALKKGPVIRPSPPPPQDALKDSRSASDTASLFMSNPFFPVWKLLTMPGKSCSGRTTLRSFQTPSWMADLELKSQTLCQFTL